MADVATAQTNLLQSKWGPLPVWVWALIGLGVAWIYAKWKASKAQPSTDTATPADSGMGTDQTQAVAPQFVIENNLPPSPAQPSSPVTAPTTPPVTTTPPGTSSQPPVVAANPPKAGTGAPTGHSGTPAEPKPKAKAPLEYKVHSGDNLSSIAARYHTTWQKLWAYNTTAGNRPAATIATLKRRGPNHLVVGETILIPQ